MTNNSVQQGATLSGGAGDDTLIGGNGDDVLTGGDGQDVFVFFEDHTGFDSITDFDPTEDSILAVGFDDLIPLLRSDGAGLSGVFELQATPPVLEITSISSPSATTRDVYAFDTGATAAFRYSISRLDSDGRMYETFVLNDDGSSVSTLLDVTSVQAWSSFAQHRDAQGLNFRTETQLDDGSFNLRTYDVDAAFSFSQLLRTYTAEGGTEKTRILFLDNGSQTDTIFDWRSENGWSEYRRNYDDQGRLTFEDFRNDTGTVSQFSHDATDSFAWDRILTETNASGQMTMQRTFNDDGTRVTVNFDFTNANSWDQYQQGQNAAGDVLYGTSIQDDGSRYTTHYDYDNSRTWETKLQHFASDGTLLSESYAMDNGDLFVA